MPPQHVAVLGAGITGLSSAFHLARTFPRTKITLLEERPRVGGWINSQRIKLLDGRSVLLEAGPRTLRPNSKALLELIHLLQLEGSILRTFNTSPAARNRYLHIPGTNGLTLLPTSPVSLLTSRLTPVMLGAAMRDLFSPSNLPNSVSDESVDSFLSRRFGSRFARDLGSALVHGIYAADSRELSVRAAFPSLWNAHSRGGGSVIRSMFTRSLQSRLTPEQEYVLGALPSFMKNVSAFSFRHGVSQLVETLKQRLLATENVEILHAPVAELRCTGRQFQVSTGSDILRPSHVVSALPLSKLSELMRCDPPLPHLTSGKFSSVTVVNLVFDAPPEHIHPSGFGYLVPRAGPSLRRSKLENAILGTVFDSATLAGQEEDSSNLTKLTVMLGGPHRMPEKIDISSLLKVLRSHLGHEIPAPVGNLVHQNTNCIPIPGVGHLERMAQLKNVLLEQPWNGRLALAGASVDGVSVGDCIESGRRAALAWS